MSLRHSPKMLQTHCNILACKSKDTTKKIKFPPDTTTWEAAQAEARLGVLVIFFAVIPRCQQMATHT